MIQRHRLVLIMVPVLLVLVLAYNNCSAPTKFSELHVTSVGNPMTPVSNEVMFAICGVINRCNPQVTLDQCQAGILPTSGFATPLGVSSNYNTLSSIMNAEASGILVGNSTAGNNCYDNINSLTCSDPLVQASYNSAQANPFLGAPNMIPLASCNQVYSAQVTPELVQSTSGVGNGANLTMSLPVTSTGSGNLLVVGITIGSNPMITMTGISDNASGGSNTWLNSNFQSTNNISNNSQTWIWYAKNSQAGATSVTLNWNGPGSGTMNVWMAEFSGMDLNNPLDIGAVANSQSASTTGVAPQVAISSPFEVVFSIITTSTTFGISAGNPFTALPIVTGDNLAYDITSSLGSYGAQWSQGSSSYCAGTVAFKAAQQ